MIVHVDALTEVAYTPFALALVFAIANTSTKDML
jgi:hypothetical protein